MFNLNLILIFLFMFSIEVLPNNAEIVIIFCFLMIFFYLLKILTPIGFQYMIDTKNEIEKSFLSIIETSINSINDSLIKRRKINEKEYLISEVMSLSINSIEPNKTLLFEQNVFFNQEAIKKYKAQFISKGNIILNKKI